MQYMLTFQNIKSICYEMFVYSFSSENPDKNRISAYGFILHYPGFILLKLTGSIRKSMKKYN